MLAPGGKAPSAFWKYVLSQKKKSMISLRLTAKLLVQCVLFPSIKEDTGRGGGVVQVLSCRGRGISGQAGLFPRRFTSTQVQVNRGRNSWGAGTPCLFIYCQWLPRAPEEEVYAHVYFTLKVVAVVGVAGGGGGGGGGSGDEGYCIWS